MARQNSNPKIREYRRPLNINIGMIIFGFIFVYLVICVVMYFRSSPIVGYEVKSGSLSVNNTYRGIALREEEVVPTVNAGYINYYAREGERVAVGNLVYSVDETGRLKDYLGGAEPGENSLSEADLDSLRTDMIHFVNDFSKEQYYKTYDFKYSMEGNVLKLANNSLLQNIQSLSTEETGLVKLCYAGNTGIVVYSVDGYENKTPSEIRTADFENENYEKIQLLNNNLVAEGDSAYKICKSEEWSVVIKADGEKAKELEEAEYVKVRFLKNQNESWGKVTLLGAADETEGDVFVQLGFTNSMITFCTERFLDVELITEEDSGLKIPNSSIVQKDFFLVPEDFVMKGDNGVDSNGVLREVYLEDGSKDKEFVETTIYRLENGEYYLDDAQLRIGDVLTKTDSVQTYTVSKRGNLIGVYNINKGYADFKQINILYQNEEYSIVESDTDYGLKVYDYIVLDAASVEEDDFVYE